MTLSWGLVLISVLLALLAYGIIVMVWAKFKLHRWGSLIRHWATVLTQPEQFEKAMRACRMAHQEYDQWCNRWAPWLLV